MRIATAAAVALLPLVASWTFPDNLQHALNPHSTEDKLSNVISSSPVLTLHRALCEVSSVTGNENAVGHLLVSFLEAHNFTVVKQSVGNYSDGRFNLYAVPDASKFSGHKDASSGGSDIFQSRPKVILSSHIDTVPPHFNYSLSAPKHGSRKDILISGRGTVDDKACVATQIAAVFSLLSNPDLNISPADLALLFVVGEETTGDGMKSFSNSDLYEATSKDLRAVLFGEPTELKLAAGHKGILMLRVYAHGKAAHSGYPWLGRSANSMILPALMVLDKLGDIPPRKGGLPRSKKFGRSTVNVGRIEGGVAANVVPEYAHAEVAFRLAGGTPDEVRRIVRNAISGADPEGLLELEFQQGYAPVVLDAGVDGFEEITVNYGTDVPNLEVGKGVKRYLYGPGSILVAHGANEGLTVGDMEEAVEGYERLVKHVLKL
ncbi:putative carboxypeptidase [Cyphellophora attinorum]|uniref:Putative carboxypeptidase n=1 Tax=Cyphellophora attinorum TaxID=1664694 RepID=A0A0N0NRS6_9EURO|nr:putative carboxypeptidase [Phialophora attinorum]KPI45438.1 putative carboxypeptidase [Phialophora attinorum]